jgi:hypothetical protein
MSVLTRGMAMDFVREGKKGMAVTSIWPASVSLSCSPRWTNVDVIIVSRLNQQQRSGLQL